MTLNEKINQIVDICKLNGSYESNFGFSIYISDREVRANPEDCLTTLIKMRIKANLLRALNELDELEDEK